MERDGTVRIKMWSDSNKENIYMNEMNVLSSQTPTFRSINSLNSKPPIFLIISSKMPLLLFKMATEINFLHLSYSFH
jgi:hypothetical protein